MTRNIAVQNPSSIMPNQEEDIQHVESECRHREEVHGGDGFAMIPQKGEPALPGFVGSRSLAHPAGDTAFGNLEPEHDEFAMDARSSRGGILGHHSEDQMADLLGHRPSADRLPHA
jgi:hypothetical protein